MNKILKLAMILFLVSAIVAGVLGAVYVVTEPNITAYAHQKQLDAFASVTDAELDLDAAVAPEGASFEGGTITSVIPAKDGSVYVVQADVSGSQGTITLVVGVDKESLTCTGISIISSSETSGLGAEASKDYFRDQFPGKDVDSVHITKDGGQINAITGATITSRAVTNAASAAIDYVVSMG